jgi:hypothetical protein
VSGSTFIIDLTTVYGTPSNFTISDNKGNTYTEIVRADNFYPTYSLVRLVCFNGAGGTGHQFTVSDSGGHEMCIYVTELKNCTALAGTSGATNSSVSGLNLTSTGPTDSGNLNVTDSAALMHGAHSGNGLTFSYTFVGNPGYTELDTEPGPNQAQGASFYKLLDNGGGGIALTGQAATPTAGTAAASIDLPLVGQSTSSAAGTIAAATAPPLAGASATASPGTMIPADSVALAGSPLSSSAGTAVAAPAVPLVGSAITAATGTVSASVGGDVSAALRRRPAPRRRAPRFRSRDPASRRRPAR